MLEDLRVMEAIAPEILTTIQERYRILQNIYWMQPVGRRVLADNLDVTERVLRPETDSLKNWNSVKHQKVG